MLADTCLDSIAFLCIFWVKIAHLWFCMTLKVQNSNNLLPLFVTSLHLNCSSTNFLTLLFCTLMLQLSLSSLVQQEIYANIINISLIANTKGVYIKMHLLCPKIHNPIVKVKPEQHKKPSALICFLKD